MAELPLTDLARLVERLPTPFVLVDAERRIVGASPAAQALLDDGALPPQAATIGDPFAADCMPDGVALLALAAPPIAPPADVAALAGEIAHDFNNLLGVIINFTSLAASGLPVGSPVASDLQEVLTAARRAAELTSHLTHLSAGAGTPEPEPRPGG